MALVARNGLWLTKGVPADAQLRATGIVEAVATGQLRLASLASTVAFDAGGQASVLTIGSNSVVVNANLDVRGAVNNIQTNDLFVRDRLICVANGDGLAAAADLTDGAGVLVGGAATEGTSNEVSVRWHKPAAAGAQPVWDLSGGALRISRTMPGGVVVSYALQISDAAELEVTRRTAPFAAAESAAKYQRVAVFGRPATGAEAASGASAIVLPTSTNPF
jgi:hypothetical protein